MTGMRFPISRPFFFLAATFLLWLLCACDRAVVSSADLAPADGTAGSNQAPDGSVSDPGTAEPGGPSLLPSGGKNTILIPMDNSPSWKELAFLAAVPAGMKINKGMPSVIALTVNGGDVTKFHADYLKRYIPDHIYSVGTANGYPGIRQLASSSLDDSCVELSGFWGSSAQVVLANGSDYRLGLAASGLAGRLRAPLFFWGTDGISTRTIDRVKALGAKSALLVGASKTAESQLAAAGVTSTSLADDKAIITWMKGNGLTPEYLAVCNANDRNRGYAHKSSLSAPLLAAGRDGAVVALAYDSEYNTGFMPKSTTTSRPNGAADSVGGKWHLGTCTVNGGTYDFVLSHSQMREDNAGPFEADRANIDFNKNGNFGDAGETVPRGAIIDINGKKYMVDVDSKATTEPDWALSFGDIKFTYPAYPEIKQNLESYYAVLGHHPKYLAMVGLPDALPLATLIDFKTQQWTLSSDQLYANTDGDPFFEIATGRIIAEDVTYGTLASSRSLTYPDLIGDPDVWANTVYSYGTFPADEKVHQNIFRNYNFNVKYIDESNWQESDRAKNGYYIHDSHGWPFGCIPFDTEPASPSVVTSGGCNAGNIEDTFYGGSLHEYKQFGAVKMARMGIVGFQGFSCYAHDAYNLARSAFLNALLDQDASMGEAHLSALHATLAADQGKYEIDGQMLYGDPALHIYKPSVAPRYAPAKIVANGRSLSAIAPGNYFAEKYEEPDKYIYHGPGLSGAGTNRTFVASYTTKLAIAGLTQDSTPPSPLGWSGKYKVDEHQDGTRTIYWMVRFEEFDGKTGTFKQKVQKIDYTLK